MNEQGRVSLQQAKHLKDKVVDNNEMAEIYINSKDAAKILIDSLSKIDFIVEYEAF